MNNISSELVMAYIGLGSNLENPITQINSARLAINQIDEINECSFSSLYQSLPMGPQDQPDYVNAVMGIMTSLEPLVLLRYLQSIENAQGRVRNTERWGARILDLDILVYGNTVLDLPDLKVPHIGISDRAFVLYPLYEIAPDLFIPSIGALGDLLAKCPLDGLRLLN